MSLIQKLRNLISVEGVRAARAANAELIRVLERDGGKRQPVLEPVFEHDAGMRELADRANGIQGIRK